MNKDYSFSVACSKSGFSLSPQVTNETYNLQHFLDSSRVHSWRSILRGKRKLLTRVLIQFVNLHTNGLATIYYALWYYAAQWLSQYSELEFGGINEMLTMLVLREPPRSILKNPNRLSTDFFTLSLTGEIKKTGEKGVEQLEKLIRKKRNKSHSKTQKQSEY